MFEKLWNYKKVNGILIDNFNDNYSESMKAEKIIALEDHMFISDDGQHDNLSEKGLSQQQATNQAHQILHNLYICGSNNENNKRWLEILAPSLSLYFVSKLIRMLHILRQLPSDISWKNYSTNGMLTSIAKGILPDCKSTYKALFSKRSIKDYFHKNFPTTLSNNRLIHLKRDKNFESRKSQIKKNGVLLWSTNIAHEPVTCKIAGLLVSDNIPSYCVVSRKIDFPFVIPQTTLRDAPWKQKLKKDLISLRRFLDYIAEYIINDLVIEATESSKAEMVKFLRGKLEVFFVPQAADALALAQRALDLFEPQTVFIKDIGDYQTRALAWSARRKNIPVWHLQQGTITPDAIEWKWDIADKHFVWGEWSRELVIALGLPEKNIYITGTPKLSPLSVRQEIKPMPTISRSRALFTLMPASPLTYGNGGALSLSECQGIMKLLFKWVKLMEGRMTLQIKPRPLQDHPWFDPFSLNLPDHVKILPNDLSVGDALENTDIVVTTHSTVAIDAITMCKPLLFLSWGYESHPFKEAAQFGAAEIADTSDKLKDITDKLLSDKNYHDKMIRNQINYRPRIAKYTGEESAKKITSLLSKTSIH